MTPSLFFWLAVGLLAVAGYVAYRWITRPRPNGARERGYSDARAGRSVHPYDLDPPR